MIPIEKPFLTSYTPKVDLIPDLQVWYKKYKPTHIFMNTELYAILQELCMPNIRGEGPDEKIELWGARIATGKMYFINAAVIPIPLDRYNLAYGYIMEGADER